MLSGRSSGHVPRAVDLGDDRPDLSGRTNQRHKRGKPSRAVNVTKTTLEGLFADELKQLQPTPGYMRLVKGLALRAWQERVRITPRTSHTGWTS